MCPYVRYVTSKHELTEVIVGPTRMAHKMNEVLK